MRPLRWRDEATIAALLAALAATLALGGWAWRLDQLVYDLGLSLWTRPIPPGIVIVAIDDASVQAIGRWPWRRAVHATLLERIADAQPKAVALDLVFSEADPDPNQDRLLAAALRHASPVVLPVSWQTDDAGSMAPLEPVAPLREAARLGAAESVVDADGVLRHAFLHAVPPPPATQPYAHFALALLQAGGEKVDARVPVDNTFAPDPTGHWQRADRLLIRYAGPPGHVDRVSYADVLSGAVPPARLAGRYVLVGMTAQGLGDTLATPVNAGHQAMSGIEVLANLLYTLRSGDAIDAVPDAQVATLSAALLIALLIAFGRFGPRVALPTAVITLPLAVGFSLLALRAGVWCSPVPYALAAALAYPLWSWRRLERAVTGMDQEIARLLAEPVPDGAASDRSAVVDVDSPERGDEVDARLQNLQRAGTLVRDARRFLADALAAMPTAMLVGDEHGRVLLANPNAAALFDVEKSAELHGLDLLRLVDEFVTAEPFDWRGAIAALAAGPAAAPGIAVEGRLGGGGDYIVHLAAVTLHGLRRLVVTIADVEPIKRAQREREEVLAFVSHDLRSPASSIVLLADLNLQGAVQTPHDELLRELRRLAARTLAMSEDFVRAAQVQTQPLQRAPVALQALVDDALADLRGQALAAAVDLHTRIDDGAREVAVDRALVVRAVCNLVSNAIKHSPPGSSVDVSAGVDPTAAPALLRISVSDHGPGLAPEQLTQLALGDRGAAVHDPRGVGLGLLFVQRVAQRHDGGLRARARSDRGGAALELELALSGNP